MAVTAAHRRAVALGSVLLGGKLQAAGYHLAEPSFGPAQLALSLLVSGNKNHLGTAHRMRRPGPYDQRKVASRFRPA